MSVALNAFILIFVSELADKSRVLGLLLTSTYKSRWRVFFGMTWAYALLDGASVWFGTRLSHFYTGPYLNIGAGLLFIVFGILSLVMGNETEDAGKNWLMKIEKWGPFLVSFVAILVGELGDRTQISSAAMAAETRRPWPVFGGMMAAFIVLNLLTVFLGGKISERLKFSTIKKAGGVLFILTGIWFLIRN